MSSLPKSDSPIAFSVNVARLPQRGMPVTIEADEEQRRNLAEAHGLVDVDNLRAEIFVAPWKRNGVRVSGKIEAQIVQTCIASLEPLTNRISETFDQIYLPENSKLGREGFGQGGEIILDVEGADSPEIFAGDWIDVGALAEEFFGLGIDPYPRKQGVGQSPDTASEGQEPREGALAERLRAALTKPRA